MAQQYGASDSITVQLEGPFGSAGAVVKLTQVNLAQNAWKGAQSPYAQTAAVEGISVSSMVDVQPTNEQLDSFRQRGIALTAENDGGTVTFYAIGSKPEEDLALQVSLTEVIA